MATKITGVRTLALLAGSVLALTACATSNGSPDAGTAPAVRVPTSDTKLVWAYDQEFAQYNPNTASGFTQANFVVLNGVLSGFWQFKPDGTLKPNTDFGTQEKVNDSPLTVKYEINENAVWSDGEPIDCDDFVLAWLANGGLTGDGGFSSAGIAGYQDQKKPQCADGGRDITVVYRKPFADWAGMYGPGVLVPAHVVEKQAGLDKDIIDLASTPTSAELAPAITFYNTGWALNPGQLKKDIMPSSGPYVIDSWAPHQSITLKANSRWWGTPPKTGTIVIRYIGGPQQAQALQNGEIHAMDPQPQVDVVAQLKALGSKISLSTSEQYSFEHLDFNFAGQFKDRTLREAFAKCVPRQQIVDNLVKPQNPKAEIYQSRFIFPFQPEYAAFENAVGGEKYNVVDIAGAKRLLAGRTPTVRIGWRKDPEQLNKRRTDTLSLIRASCGQAGFKVVDGGTPTFFESELIAGNCDVAMFAWTGSPLVSGNNGIYETGGGQNPGKYSDPRVDRLMAEVYAELDRAKQTALLKQVDTLLWADLATMPLFAYPAVFASAKNVHGLEYNATQADLTWNVENWAAS